jgi:hypothetical protein
MENENSTLKRSVLLIGGPDAGKSNFLFRVWMAIDGEQGTLKKDGLPENLQYLREGAEQILQGSFAERTSTTKDVVEKVSINIQSQNGSGIAIRGCIVIPDVPGEHVVKICKSRKWSELWEHAITEDSACLMFIRADSDEIVAPLDWADCIELCGSELPAPPIEQSALNTEQELDATNEMELPTQVVLTEWIQFLRKAFTARVGGHFRPKFGVLIAAWDAVPLEQQSRGPMRYLKENFPMMHQFIESNAESFDFQVFGVSIVAGDLKNDEDFRKSFFESDPRAAGYVIHSLVGKKSPSTDITLPIAWALGIE